MFGTGLQPTRRLGVCTAVGGTGVKKPQEICTSAADCKKGLVCGFADKFHWLREEEKTDKRCCNGNKLVNGFCWDQREGQKCNFWNTGYSLDTLKDKSSPAHVGLTDSFWNNFPGLGLSSLTDKPTTQCEMGLYCDKDTLTCTKPDLKNGDVCTKIETGAHSRRCESGFCHCSISTGNCECKAQRMSTCEGDRFGFSRPTDLRKDADLPVELRIEKPEEKDSYQTQHILSPEGAARFSACTWDKVDMDESEQVEGAVPKTTQCSGSQYAVRPYLLSYS